MADALGAMADALGMTKETLDMIPLRPGRLNGVPLLNGVLRRCACDAVRASVDGLGVAGVRTQVCRRLGVRHGKYGKIVIFEDAVCAHQKAVRCG